MGPCCDDHRQPRMYGRSCSLGCTSPVLWHSVCADSSPGVHCRRILPSLCHSLRTVRRAGARRERTSLLSCKASCGQPIPKSVAATPPVIPCVRTAEPWIRRRRTLPSSCHSIRADNRARASSRTHLRPRARPPRVQTAQLRVHPRAPGHPHPTGRHLRRGHSTRPGACRPGRGHSTPSGTAIPSPNASPVPGRTEMSPAAAPECGVFMPRPKTPVRRAGFDCRYSPPRQGVTRLLAGTRMAPVIYCTRVGCHWRRVGCTPGRWDLRAVRTTPGQ